MFYEFYRHRLIIKTKNKPIINILYLKREYSCQLGMDINEQKHFLELKVIWKDEHMFELQVTACNGKFSGRTEVYEQSENLLQFTKQLTGYLHNNKTLFYEAGIKDSISYFSMRYYPLGKTGCIGVEVHLEENVANEFRPEEKSKLKLELIVEPAAIDNFQKELFTLAKNEEGKAVLFGREHRFS